MTREKQPKFLTISAFDTSARLTMTFYFPRGQVCSLIPSAFSVVRKKNIYTRDVRPIRRDFENHRGNYPRRLFNIKKKLHYTLFRCEIIET